MKITNKDIERDVSFVLGEIKNAEVEIPSFWRCVWPSLVFAPLFFVWQAYMFFSYKSFHDPSVILGVYFFISFMSILVSTQLRGKYFALPGSVRARSLIIGLLKKKCRFYVLLWLITNVLAGIIMRHLNFNTEVIIPYFLCVSLLVIWFIAIADLSRYDLSLLSAAIQRWREGREIDTPSAAR